MENKQKVFSYSTTERVDNYIKELMEYYGIDKKNILLNYLVVNKIKEIKGIKGE